MHALKILHFHFVTALVLSFSQINLAISQNSFYHSPLLESITNGNLSGVKDAIDHGYSVNAKDSSGISVLMVATYLGNLDVVKFLVSKGADYHYKSILPLKGDSYYGNLLSIAAGQGKLDIVQYFVEKCKIFVDDREIGLDGSKDAGWTALQWASSVGNTDIIKYLLEKGAQIEGPNPLESPLLCAIVSKKDKAAALLIENNANVNAKDANGTSMLMLAINSCSQELIQYLLKNGADISEGGKLVFDDSLGLYTNSPLCAATYKNKYQIVKYLIKVDPVESNIFYSYHNWTPLHWACANPKIDEKIIKLLTENSENHFSKDSIGLTPIELAIELKNIEAIKHLKGYAGINDEDYNRTNVYPLHFAVTKGDFNVVYEILKNTSNINEKGKDNMTPFEIAIDKGNLEILKLLYCYAAKKAFPNLEKKDLFTKNFATKNVEIYNFINHPFLDPFVLLQVGLFQEVDKNLAFNGTWVKQKDNTGKSLLHLAAAYGYLSTTELLVKSGADVNAKDNNGETPIFEAIRKEHLLVIDKLLEAGANVETLNNNEMSPFTLSFAIGGYHQIYKKLYLYGGVPNEKLGKIGVTPAIAAVWANDVNALKFLHLAGCDFTIKTNKGNDAIFYAKLQGKRKIIDFFQKREVDPFTAYKLGFRHIVLDSLKKIGGFRGILDNLDWVSTTLFEAVKQGDSEIVDILLRQGWPVSIPDKLGQSILTYAVKFSQDKIIKLILEKGSNIDIKFRDYEAKTLLHYAVEYEQENLFNYLTENKIDLNVRDTLGRTPFMYAIYLGNLEYANRLLKLGCNMILFDTLGITPYGLSSIRGYSNLMQALETRGAKVDNLSKSTLEVCPNRGHESSITSLMFSKDEKYIISSSADKISFWEIKTGIEVKTLEKRPSRKVLHSNDGNFLVSFSPSFISGSGDYMFLIDAKLLTPVKYYKLTGDWSVQTASFSPDDKHLYIGLNTFMKKERSLKKIHLRTGKLIYEYPLTETVSSIQVIKNNNIICGLENGLLAIINENNNAIKYFDINIGPIAHLSATSDGTYLFATSDESGLIAIWDISKQSIAKIIKLNHQKIKSVIWNDDINTLLITTNLELCTYDIVTDSKKTIEKYTNSKIGINLCKSTTGNYIALSYSDKSISFFNTKTLQLLKTFEGTTIPIKKDVYLPGVDQIYFSTENDQIHKFDLMAFKIKKLSNHKFENINQFCVDPKSKLLAVAEGQTIIISSPKIMLDAVPIRSWNVSEEDNYSDVYYSESTNRLSLINLENDKKIIEFDRSMREESAVVFSPDGKYLISGNAAGNMILWNIATGTFQKNMDAHSDKITSIKYSPDGKLFATTSFDSSIILWNASTFTPFDTLKGHFRWVLTSDFSPTSKKLWSGSIDGQIREWDFANPKNILTKIINDERFYISDLDFSGNGKEVIVSNYLHKEILLFNVDSSKLIYKLAAHNANVSNVHFAFNDTRIISSGEDGAIKLWDAKKGTEIVSIYPNKESPEDFFAYSPDGFYYSTKNASKRFGFSYKGETFPFDQFDLKLNRPDLILNKIPNTDGNLINFYHNAYKKRLQKMGFTEEMLSEGFHIPNIRIISENIPITTDRSEVRFKIQATDSEKKLDRIYLYVNGIPVDGLKGTSLRNLNIMDYQGEIVLPLSAGENKIQVSVLNQAGAESLKETVYVTCTAPPRKPDLYFIGIGSGQFQNKAMNLDFPAKDVRDLAALWTKNKERYGRIVIDTLLQSNVTVAKVAALKQRLMQTKVDDQVVFFVAGHGILDDSLDYYLAAYNTDFKKPKNGSIPYDLLDNLLDAIPARQKLMLMDACHAGEIDKENVIPVIEQRSIKGTVKFRSVGTDVAPRKLSLENSFELMKELFVDLRRGTGATVIASAGGVEAAMEGTQWNNSVFMYALLSGLQEKKADLNKDGAIMVSELQNYLGAEVQRLTGGVQRPTSRVENVANDWRIW